MGQVHALINAGERERIVDATVGEFLDTVRAEADLLPATFEIYAKKFRRLVAGVVRIDGGRAKHDHHGTGYQDWLTRISAVKLSRLTTRSPATSAKRYDGLGHGSCHSAQWEPSSPSPIAISLPLESSTGN